MAEFKKVAIIHYWLVSNRGGEKVLEALCELYPEADIFTHVYNEDEFLDSPISKHKIFETFIAKLPFSKKAYKNYLPLMPIALEQLDLSGYDLVISSESGPAKGIIPHPGQVHVCYCHSPMRYVWDLYFSYKDKAGFIKRALMAPLCHYIRRWDQLTSMNVSHFIANSGFVGSRIKGCYNRDSKVIHPPVDFDSFQLSEKDPEDFYLVLGQLVPYKNTSLAIEAFNESGRTLKVVGEGEELAYLKSISGENIELLGRLSFPEIKVLLSSCKALVFPGVEDFGIVPLEAMASGRPVIALKQGGALETVKEGVSGMFFDDATVLSLNQSIDEFEENIDSFKPDTIRRYSERFSKEEFKRKLSDYLSDL